LLALVEGHGYGFEDKIFYVKEKGKGVAGMECVDSMAKVQCMLQLYAEAKVLNLTVIRQNSPFPLGLNNEELQAEEVYDFPLSVDSHGVTYISEDEAVYPVAMDYSDVIFLGTQQSCNMDKGKGKMTADYEVVPVQVIDPEEDLIWSGRNIGEYRPEDHFSGLAEEYELMKKLKRQKKEAELDPESVLIADLLRKQKKARADPELHFEGDTNVEEIFEVESDSSNEEEYEDQEEGVDTSIKVPVKPGPTSRSHHELEEEEEYNFLPSPDEETYDDLPDSEDDGFVPKFLLQSRRKSRAKKLKKRIWYDETRENAHEQFAIKLCFRDVYQFRVALRNYHIAQLRNYAYHRNNPDSIIVEYFEQEQGCPFYLTASKIAHEKTFCIRKFRARHTCIPHGENTKVSVDWLAF
jgi:hypothetical protein